MTSYQICASVFEEAEADYMTHKLSFCFLVWKFNCYQASTKYWPFELLEKRFGGF